MELSKRKWFVTWFFLSLAVLDKFRSAFWNRWEDQCENKTNLCQFMRITLVWAPLVVTLHIILYGGALFALAVLPVNLFGWSGYFSIIIGIVTIIAAIIGIGFVAATLEWLSDRRKARRRETKAQLEQLEDDFVVELTKAPEKPKGPTFWQLLMANARAAKQRICPIITFEK